MISAFILFSLLLGSRRTTPVASGQTSKQFFTELRDAGGVTPLAQMVCFPAEGQGEDSTFILVGFTKDFASTLRAKGKEVPKVFLDAETAGENHQALMAWIFSHGVQLQKDPEVLPAVIGSHGKMWSTDFAHSEGSESHKTTLRMVFSLAGRYSRDVLVDGVVAASVYGKCEPIDYTNPKTR